MLLPSSDQRRLFNDIVDFAKTDINPNATDRNRNRQFSRELWALCGGRLGLQGLPAPVEYGGHAATIGTTAYAMEALGYACDDSGFAFAIGAHLLACVVPILHHGSKAQKDRYLTALCTGTLIGCNAMTEAEGGSDIFAIRTTAAPVDGGYVINGSKSFVTNAPEAGIAIVYARSNPTKGFVGGLSAFIVDASLLSNCSRLDQEPLKTCSVGAFALDNVPVSHDDCLGGEGNGAGVFNHCMTWERVCLAAMHVGRMRRILEDTISFTKGRKTAEGSLSRFQSVTNRIANMKVKTEAAAALTYRAAAKMDMKRVATLEAAEAKLFTSEAFVAVATDAMQILSSTAMLADSKIGDSLTHALASTNYSGTNDIQRNIISKWLLCE
jgi:alkylation response protein AidB-like acyl-CoA dehydrogenase